MSAKTRQYTTRILHASGLVEPTKQLLREWNLARDVDANLSAFKGAGALFRTSTQRAKELLSLIEARYLREPQVLRGLVSLAKARAEYPILELILGYHAALRDDLLFDFAADFLFPLRLRGAGHVSSDEAHDFLGQLEAPDGPTSWASPTMRAASRKLLTAWRDFGLLEGEAKKSITTRAIPTEAVVWIATHRSAEVVRAADLAEDRAFRLLLLTPEEVERHLRAADARGLLRYQGGGAIARLDLHHPSVEALAHALE